MHRFTRRVLRRVEATPDLRQRLHSTARTLEELQAAAKVVRGIRDDTIAQMGQRGTAVHELSKLSGMSKSHVEAAVRRGFDEQKRAS